MAIWGAHRNVIINMAGETDEEYKKRVLAEAEALVIKAKEAAEDVVKTIGSRV